MNLDTGTVDFQSADPVNFYVICIPHESIGELVLEYCNRRIVQSYRSTKYSTVRRGTACCMLHILLYLVPRIDAVIIVALALF